MTLSGNSATHGGVVNVGTRLVLTNTILDNSPAIDGVNGVDGTSDDQRGRPRPFGGGFDIGAVERQAADSRISPRLFMALVRR